MRIVHLADTHLGYRQFSGKLDPDRGLNQRECDVYDRWNEAIEIAISLKPDLVIHAGDLFDSSRPAPKALGVALDGFARLREAGLPTIAIAGNHEAPRFRSGGSVFEILQRFGVHAVWEGPQTIDIEGLAIHAVPHEPSPDRLKEDIRSLGLRAEAKGNVLVLHTGLEAIPRQGYGEVNEIALDPKVLAEADYDYIALGHLHRFQAPQLNATYPGSLERLDFADLEGEKAVVEIDLDAGAGSEDFVTRHPLAARSVLDLGIACNDLGPAEVCEEVDKELHGAGTAGAVIRVRLESIARDVYQSLDIDNIDGLLADCMHYVVQVGRSGLAGSTEDELEDVSFDAFALARIPRDVDQAAVLGIAKGFIGEAAQDEAEEAAR